MATKIVDLVKAKEEAKEPFVAFEYFPPRTDKGLENLYRRVQLMKHQGGFAPTSLWRNLQFPSRLSSCHDTRSPHVRGCDLGGRRQHL